MRFEHCKRCGGDWCYRGVGRALRCGICKSPYWDREKRNDVPSVSRSKNGSIPVSGPGNGSAIGGGKIGRAEPIQLPERVRVAQAVESGSDAGFGGDAEAVKVCKSCGERLIPSRGFWVCTDDFCGRKDQQQGRVA